MIDLASLERWRFAPEQGLSHARVTGLNVSPSGESALVATAAGVDRIDLADRSVSNLMSLDGLIGLVCSPGSAPRATISMSFLRASHCPIWSSAAFWR